VPFSQHSERVDLFLPNHEDSLLLVIKIEFEGNLDVDQRLIPQNGVLILSPVRGEIIHGKSTMIRNGGDIRMGPAAEVITENNTCSINESGALTQWHHPGDGLSWEISFPEAGIYKIEAITENRCHSMPWEGARSVRLEFAGRQLEAELKEDKTLVSPCYARAGSDLGVLEVSADTNGILKLTTVNIDSPAAINMNLTALNIYGQKGGQKHEN